MIAYLLAALAPFCLLVPVAPWVCLIGVLLLVSMALVRGRVPWRIGMVCLVSFVLFAPLLAPFPVDAAVDAEAAFPLGRDRLERDLFSRLLNGHRVSLAIAFAGAALASLMSFLVGGLLGLSGKIPKRFVNILFQAYLAVPGIIYLLLALVFFEEGSLTLILVFGFMLWPDGARLIQARVESLLEADFVWAARMRGQSERKILFGEILPNLKDLVLTTFAVQLATALMIESALGYLGLGHEVGTPSLGRLIEEGVRLSSTSPTLFLAAMLPFIAWLIALRLEIRSRARDQETRLFSAKVSP